MRHDCIFVSSDSDGNSLQRTERKTLSDFIGSILGRNERSITQQAM